MDQNYGYMTYGRPMGIALDAATHVLYISYFDRAYGWYTSFQIGVLNLDTNRHAIIAGKMSSSPEWYGYAEGLIGSAKYQDPQGLAFDSVNKILYVADTSTNKIRTIDLGSYYTSVTSATQTQLDGSALTTSGTTTFPTVSLNFALL